MERAAGVTRRLAGRNGGTAVFTAICVLAALGTGLRLGYAWNGSEPVVDAQAYSAIARNLDEGNGFTQRTPETRQLTQQPSNYSPGLPLFVAGIYKLSGGVDERLARIVLALIASTVLLSGYLIARRLSGPVAGLIAVGALAIYPAFLEYGGMLMTEPLAAALLTASMLGILRAFERESLRAWVLPALGLGATAMVRPEYLYIGVALAVVVFALRVRSDARAALARVAVLLAGIAVVVVPWTIRNAIELDRFVPISTGGGQVLFAGWYLPSGGNPERVGAEVLERHPGLRSQVDGIDGAAGQPPLESILAALAKQQHPNLDSDEALSRMGKRLIRSDVSDHPAETAGLVGKKVTRIWVVGARSGMRSVPWRIFQLLIVIPALAGLVVLATRRRREAALIGVVLLGVTTIAALTVASPRRVLVVMPLVAALSGFAWVELGIRMRRA